MKNKSFVSMEKKKCLVCGKDFDTGSILMDRTLRDSLEKETVTGWALCDEHKKLYEDGYIALVVCDESKSVHLGATADEVYRTGEVIHVRSKAAKLLFDREIDGPFAFINEEAAKNLKEFVNANTAKDGGDESK